MSKKDSLIFTVTQNDLENHKRLDTYLSEKLPEISRSLIKKQFENNQFTSESKLEIKKMPPIDTVIYYEETEPIETDIIPENIPLEVLYEDEYLIIINKEAGMVVHPAPGNYTGTLVNAILYHCPDLKGIGNEKRPGIVHRLDKGTTGIMVVAKTQQTHAGLVQLFSTHDITRKYEAIALGVKIPSQDTLIAPIGRSHQNRLKMAINVEPSKKAITHFKTLEYFKNFSHVELTLETGRTHQIRVHLSSLLNSPILNDELYGRLKEEKLKLSHLSKQIVKDYTHPFLHAKILGFLHPITKKELFFEKEPPLIFQQMLKQLRDEQHV